jgi:hypothetical protein
MLTSAEMYARAETMDDVFEAALAENDEYAREQARKRTFGRLLGAESVLDDCVYFARRRIAARIADIRRRAESEIQFFERELAMHEELLGGVRDDLASGLLRPGLDEVVRMIGDAMRTDGEPELAGRLATVADLIAAPMSERAS